MRSFAAALFLAPLLVSAKLAIFNGTYSHGVFTFTEFAWPDAPAQYDIALVGPSNKTVIESGLTPANGTTTVTLPNTTPGGSYHVALIGAGTNASETYSTGSGFAVSPSDFNSTATGSTTTTTSTTSMTPVVTDSISLLTTDTVVVSGSITTTILETESFTVSFTTTPTPTKNTLTTVTTTSGAATATITTKASGAMNLKAPVTVGGLLVGGVAIAAAILF